MTGRISGRCLCGACHYDTSDDPINVFACHCRRCQKATGSAFFPRILVPLDGVSIAGPVSWYEAESGLRRGFCAVCGSPLFSERRDRNAVGLSAGSLDETALFQPTGHIWMSEKQDWLALDDGLSQHLFGPSFEGS